jgi:hypothetical protein
LRIELTRQTFLRALGAGAAWFVVGNTLGCEPQQARNSHTSPAHPELVRSSGLPSAPAKRDTLTFRSRPDLNPPTVEVNTQAHEAAPGYVFVSPKKGPGQDGPMILDARGRLVWFHPVKHEPHYYAMDLKVQRFRGEFVLTWWEGYVRVFGVGSYKIFDNSYREIARVRAGNGYRGDLHEFLITPEDTALLTIYGTVPADLTAFGRSKDGQAYEGILQEVDIETGEVLFEWHSSEHVSIDESYGKPPDNPKYSFDYFHINSIDVDYDGHLLVSARNTWAVYKIDRYTGEVLWRLGGKKSDFEMGEGTRFAFQHDARRQQDGTITIFDNGAVPQVHDQSRGIVVRFDEQRMSVSLVKEYTHAHKLLAGTQGNLQVLPSGNVFIGWGGEGFFSEYSSDGKLLFDANFPPHNESYRAYRFRWNGQPSGLPSMVAERSSDHEVRLYPSWNGATEVATWEVLAGPEAEDLESIGSIPSDGFESTIIADTSEPYVGVRAKDSSGRVLGASKAVKADGT